MVAVSTINENRRRAAFFPGYSALEDREVRSRAGTVYDRSKMCSRERVFCFIETTEV